MMSEICDSDSDNNCDYNGRSHCTVHARKLPGISHRRHPIHPLQEKCKTYSKVTNFLFSLGQAIKMRYAHHAHKPIAGRCIDYMRVAAANCL